jgi:glucose-1-phosphate adenylyltransferase
VGEGSLVEDSILMPGAIVGRNAKIIRAIVGEGAVVGEGCLVGSVESEDIAVVGSGETIHLEEELKEAEPV